MAVSASGRPGKTGQRSGRILRGIATVFCAGLLTLTAASAPADAKDVPLRPEVPPASGSVVVIDGRPPEESRFKNYSSSITSCDYAITRMSDKDQSVGRIDRLKFDLAASLGDRLKGKTVTVTRYVIYFNGHTFFRTRAKGIVGKGLAADVMFGMSADCPRERTTAGWYDASEVTTPHSPFIAEVSVRIDGKDYSARSVYSPPLQLYASHATKVEESAAIAETIRLANQALILAFG